MEAELDSGDNQISMPGVVAPDVCAMLLADKRSANTRRAYAFDLRAFFRATYGRDPSSALVAEFLRLSTEEMTQIVLRYKASLIAQQKTEATINRRLSA